MTNPDLRTGDQEAGDTRGPGVVEIPGGRSAIIAKDGPEGESVHMAEPLAVGTRLTVRAVSSLAQKHPDAGRVGETSIDKRPLASASVTSEGIEGDWQSDRKHHGGTDKALFALSDVAGRHWDEVLGRDDVPGYYGENVRIEGELDRLEFGARVRIGSVIAEVTGSRNPCMTLSRWVDRPGFVREYAEFGFVGIYFKVLEEGRIEPGDELEVLSTPGHGVSCDRWFTGRLTSDAQALLASERDGRLTIADYMRPYITHAAKRDS